MRILTSAAALLLLAACTTPQERAARMAAEMQQMMVVYGPACTQLGYPLNSNEWRDCVLRLATKEDMERVNTYPGYYGGWGPGAWRSGVFWGPYW